MSSQPRSTRLIVTRPRAQADDWVHHLRAHGIDAVALPLIEIAPAAAPELVRAAWSDLPQCRAAVFVSPNAVEQFFALRPAQATWPGQVLAATTGPGSDTALQKAGVPAAQRIAPLEDAAQFDSESLWARINDQPWSGAMRCAAGTPAFCRAVSLPGQVLAATTGPGQVA